MLRNGHFQWAALRQPMTEKIRGSLQPHAKPWVYFGRHSAPSICPMPGNCLSFLFQRLMKGKCPAAPSRMCRPPGSLCSPSTGGKGSAMLCSGPPKQAGSTTERIQHHLLSHPSVPKHSPTAHPSRAGAAGCLKQCWHTGVKQDCPSSAGIR